MPGIAASTRLTCSFGPAPKPTAAPENSFDFDATWAWISSPRTISQGPVRPSISLESAVVMARDVVDPGGARILSLATQVGQGDLDVLGPNA